MRATDSSIPGEIVRAMGDTSRDPRSGGGQRRNDGVERWHGDVERRNDRGGEARARRRPESWPSVVQAVAYVEQVIVEGGAERVARRLLVR